MRYYFKIPLFKNSFLLSLHEMRGNSQPNEPLAQLTSSIGFIFLIIYTDRAPPLWALAGLDSSCIYRILYFYCTDENGTCLWNEQNLTVTMIKIKMRPPPAAPAHPHQTHSRRRCMVTRASNSRDYKKAQMVVKRLWNVSITRAASAFIGNSHSPVLWRARR